jgi:hypothetical protein
LEGEGCKTRLAATDHLVMRQIESKKDGFRGWLCCFLAFGTDEIGQWV